MHALVKEVVKATITTIVIVLFSEVNSQLKHGMHVSQMFPVKQGVIYYVSLRKGRCFGSAQVFP